MMRSFFRRVAAALGITFLLTGGAAEARAPQAGTPALWAVSDADTTVYLFGTIHLLPEKFQWRTPAFEQAVKQSQQLVVETIIDDKNPTQMMTLLVSMGFAKGLPPLADRVAPDKRAALDAAIKKSGLPPASFNQMKTWMAAFTLMTSQFRDMGLKGQEGVEAVLRSRFSGDGKPIGELETNAQQFSFFDGLPEKAQRELLSGALETPESANAEFDLMLTAWAKGDIRGIAKYFDHDLASSPELRQALIQRRNANWAQWIEQRMAQPGAIMVAVGAGHLAGNDSVIGMLEKQGYRVKRLQ